jgi:hypothetical protein
LIALITSIAIFALAPLLYKLAIRYTKAHKVIESCIFAVIVGVVVGHILPESIHVVGWVAIPIAAAGMVLPSLVERMWHNMAASVHWVPLLFAVMGLALHAAMDGAAMVEFHSVTRGAHDHFAHEGHSHPVLSWTVVLHRLPVALLIWWSLAPKHGWAFPTGIYIFLGFFTIGGYTMGAALLDLEAHDTIAWFQALVAGSLLHVALDQHDHDDHAHDKDTHGQSHPHKH